jgi:hypothetical protein
MTNDPFKNLKPLNSKPQPKKSTPSHRSDNFVESVRDMGSSVVNSLKNDVVKGTAQSIFDQLLGSTKTGQAPDTQNPDMSGLEEMIHAREQAAADEARSSEHAFQQHRQKESQVLFSFADEKVRKEIEGVRQELSMLVSTMGQVETQIEQAMMDNIVDGGLYHLNYFQKLKTWIVFMRKSLEDASAWLQMSGGRKSKGYFWTQTAKSGTKYSMSQERNVQMGAG